MEVEEECNKQQQQWTNEEEMLRKTTNSLWTGKQLTKYERTLILSKRICELEDNFRPLLWTEPDASLFDIAIKELEQGLLGHITITRPRFCPGTTTNSYYSSSSGPFGDFMAADATTDGGTKSQSSKSKEINGKDCLFLGPSPSSSSGDLPMSV